MQAPCMHDMIMGRISAYPLGLLLQWHQTPPLNWLGAHSMAAICSIVISCVHRESILLLLTTSTIVQLLFRFTCSSHAMPQITNIMLPPQIDLRDKPALEKLFASTNFDAVIHFAGLKAVGESVQKPLLYYNNNIIGTITLLEVMGAYGCKKLVFSSSATVYGWPKEVPCTEEFPLAATNPYGRTKLFIEEICRDIYRSDSEWQIILLRYFNPVGAHPSGYMGEDPRGIPNNLMPFIQQVAVGRRPALTVFGKDYNTKDGTGVRDYIHVVDLSDGHSAALQKLFDSNIGCEVYNLGTGKGTSVLEMVDAFEKASGKKIPLIMAGRRPGDAEIVFASTEKAERDLNWKAKYGIAEMCRDQWNWASKNPYGYESPDSTN